MATTNYWASGSGTGDFTSGADWSLGTAPAPGQVAEIDYGEPTLLDVSVDGFTIDIVSAQTQQAELALENATLGSAMVLEDTNSTDGQSMLVTGNTTNDGTILFNASIGGIYNGFSLAFEESSDTLTNNGAITIANSDGLFLGNGVGGTLVNNGVVYDYSARTFLDSPADGTGTIVLGNATLDVATTSTISPDQTILFTDANSTVEFDNAGGGFTGLEGTVVGFQQGDLLDFPELFLSGGYSYDPGSRILSLSTDSGTLEVRMGGSTAYTQQSFTEGADTNDGFEIGTTAPPCFAAGTRIATARGEVAVERLAAGDRVATVAGGTAPVRWLGHRRIVCARHPRPWDVMPVRIAAGAFGEASPRRDLLLSPDHAVLVDGVLIPVRYLLNGATIVQAELAEVEYWHVELPRHDVLFAEGLPAESFLDTGNRGAFANAAGVAVQLQPDFALRVWQAQACAPLVRDGARLAAARCRLFERAAALGHVMTRQPALHLIAAGRVVPPQICGRLHRFILPADARKVRLMSRSGVPAHMSAESDDCRRLGVAVERVLLDGRPIGLADARIGEGWHAAEAGDAPPAWRWTDGAAALTLGAGRVLDVVVAMTERYWVELPQAAAAGSLRGG